MGLEALRGSWKKRMFNGPCVGACRGCVVAVDAAASLSTGELNDDSGVDGGPSHCACSCCSAPDATVANRPPEALASRPFPLSCLLRGGDTPVFRPREESCSSDVESWATFADRLRGLSGGWGTGRETPLRSTLLPRPRREGVDRERVDVASDLERTRPDAASDGGGGARYWRVGGTGKV